MPIGIRHTQYVAVGAASAGFTTPMKSGLQYLFSANTDCWVKVTVTGGSAAANTADNILYKAGMGWLPLMAPDNAGTTTNSFVKVIRESADGDACLAILEGV
jgi:hypothetical protein